MHGQGQNGDLEDVGLLNDAVRRRIYGFVVQQGTAAVTRDEAAAGAGISRTLAAYHLDKLAAAGLVDVDYARPSGRTGPGAGRPAKRYAWSRREVSVSFPPRNYSLLARILAEAADSGPTSEFRAALAAAAAEEGSALGRLNKDVWTTLTAAGYEPSTDDNGTIVLLNCPFHSVVQEHTDLVCSLNHAFVQGVLAGVGDDPDLAALAPCASRCCVVVHPSAGRRVLTPKGEAGQ